MARYLFTVWPLTGHLMPNLAIARELAGLGHEIRFYTGTRGAQRAEAEGFGAFPFDRVDEQAFDDILTTRPEARHRWKRLRVQRDRYQRWLVGTLPGQSADIERIYGD